MQTDELRTLIVDALDDLKAVNVTVLDVRPMASFTDLMVVATGNSNRQVKALAERLVERCKQAGLRPLGVEGERDAEWVLVDLGEAVVHIMLPQVRDFYGLEKLWSVRPGQDTAPAGAGTPAGSGPATAPDPEPADAVRQGQKR